MALVRPVFFPDNLFSPVHYPDVVLSASSEGMGTEAAMFSTLRREDHYSPSVFNTDAWLKARHTQLRAFNTVCLWAHNLLGKAYRFQVSNDDFGTIETAIDVTIPANPGTGHIDDALGVVTEDFMWIKRVPTRYAVDFRHFVPAMGADLKPELNGIAGISYSPAQYDYPYAPGGTEFIVEEQRSDRGVLGRNPPVNLRRGAITMKMRSDFDYEPARFHLEHRWGGGSPMLIVHNEAQAERAVMAVRTGGSMLEFATDTAWPDGGEGRNAGQLTWVEHDPAEPS
jgi:hypothetical protein